MKNKNRTLKWISRERIVIFSLSTALASTVFSTSSIPLTRDFLDGLGLAVSTNSSPSGRIQLVADTAALETNNIPPRTIRPQTDTNLKTLHVNFFDCNQSVVLQRQGMYLGRSIAGSVNFAVYQGLSDGSFSLISESLISAPVGSNVVYSGALDVFLEQGKQYAFGAAWDKSMTYHYLTGNSVHPQTLPFAESFASLNISANPAALPTSLSTNLIQSDLLYLQTLIWSSNRVVRMDAQGSGFATNRMDLSVNLDGYDEVSLVFKHRSSMDEYHDGDGVFFSTNGTLFAKAQPLTNEPNWTLHGIDLDQQFAALGWTFNNDITIRFQQVDNFGWPNDGREFDDIQIYSQPVLSIEPLYTTNICRVRVKYAPVGTQWQLVFKSCLTNNNWQYRVDGAFRTDALHPTTNWLFPDSLDDSYFFKLEPVTYP